MATDKTRLLTRARGKVIKHEDGSYRCQILLTIGPEDGEGLTIDDKTPYVTFAAARAALGETAKELLAQAAKALGAIVPDRVLDLKSGQERPIGEPL